MVIIILGSETDLLWGEKIKKSLYDFGINAKMHIASAHKTPGHLMKIMARYTKDKPGVYICVAGRSNALGGFVDANTVYPVINCPPPADKYAGMDILSSLRMPTGVACMTVLECNQAALAAAKILANTDNNIRKKVTDYQKGTQKKIITADKNLNTL